MNLILVPNFHRKLITQTFSVSCFPSKGFSALHESFYKSVNKKTGPKEILKNMHSCTEEKKRGIKLPCNHTLLFAFSAQYTTLQFSKIVE